MPVYYTLTRRLLHARQPEWDLLCFLRFRHETPFISDRSAAGPLTWDEGVTTNMDSSGGGASLRDMGDLLTSQVATLVKVR